MRPSPLLSLPLVLSLAGTAPARTPPADSGFLVVANQGDHTLLLLDLATHSTLGKVQVGVNGHEVAVSPDRKFAYVPIYGNSGVGKPGTDGRTIDIVDLRARAIAGHLDLGKPVRPPLREIRPGRPAVCLRRTSQRHFCA